MSNLQSDSTTSSIQTQNQDPNQPYYSLDAFYATLLSEKFQSHTEAISFCRDLCSNYGFTVKQEQSTHKNIYIYCSREGLPDSYRNPKLNPQRNRQSQRCECRWRIVVFENDQLTWEFRKSQNLDACVHNHPLLKPEQVKKDWPREVSEKIFELARKRLPTNEIRQIVRDQYPDISWDDRRFYNRLSEERQKMKQRDTASRVIRLMNISSQICMVSAGSEDLSHYAEAKLLSILEKTCQFASVDQTTLPAPITTPFNVDPNYEEVDNTLKRALSKLDDDSKSKGHLAVPIPEYTLQAKMYGQSSVGDIRRAIFETQRPQREPRRRRSRALFQPENDDESMELDTPARKLSRQITADDDDMSIQSASSNTMESLVGYDALYQQESSSSPIYPKHRQNPLMMYDFRQEPPHSMPFSPMPRNIPRVQQPMMSSIGYNFPQMQNVVNDNEGKRYYTTTPSRTQQMMPPPFLPPQQELYANSPLIPPQQQQQQHANMFQLLDDDNGSSEQQQQLYRRVSGPN